ncbi:hypothetical protein BC828DRAFT_440196 [Blastocladiella britannica]|nr:hypothetical protein BC828DRAFT_440196 [Blastocladiella britannica]
MSSFFDLLPQPIPTTFPPTGLPSSSLSSTSSSATATATAAAVVTATPAMSIPPFLPTPWESPASTFPVPPMPVVAGGDHSSPFVLGRHTPQLSQQQHAQLHSQPSQQQQQQPQPQLQQQPQQQPLTAAIRLLRAIGIHLDPRNPVRQALASVLGLMETADTHRRWDASMIASLQSQLAAVQQQAFTAQVQLQQQQEDRQQQLSVGSTSLRSFPEGTISPTVLHTANSGHHQRHRLFNRGFVTDPTFLPIATDPDMSMLQVPSLPPPQPAVISSAPLDQHQSSSSSSYLLAPSFPFFDEIMAQQQQQQQVTRPISPIRVPSQQTLLFQLSSSPEPEGTASAGNNNVHKRSLGPLTFDEVGPHFNNPTKRRRSVLETTPSGMAASRPSSTREATPVLPVHGPSSSTGATTGTAGHPHPHPHRGGVSAPVDAKHAMQQHPTPAGIVLTNTGASVRYLHPSLAAAPDARKDMRMMLAAIPHAQQQSSASAGPTASAMGVSVSHPQSATARAEPWCVKVLVAASGRQMSVTKVREAIAAMRATSASSADALPMPPVSDPAAGGASSPATTTSSKNLPFTDDAVRQALQRMVREWPAVVLESECSDAELRARASRILGPHRAVGKLMRVGRITRTGDKWRPPVLYGWHTWWGERVSDEDAAAAAAAASAAAAAGTPSPVVHLGHHRTPSTSVSTTSTMAVKGSSGGGGSASHQHSRNSSTSTTVGPSTIDWMMPTPDLPAAGAHRQHPSHHVVVVDGTSEHDNSSNDHSLESHLHHQQQQHSNHSDHGGGVSGTGNAGGNGGAIDLITSADLMSNAAAAAADSALYIPSMMMFPSSSSSFIGFPTI